MDAEHRPGNAGPSDADDGAPGRRGRRVAIAGVVLLAALCAAGLVWRLHARPGQAAQRAQQPPAAAAAPVPAPPQTPAAPPPPFVVVPMVGEITGETGDFFRDAVLIARRREAKTVVLLFDTLGGSGPATLSVTSLMKEHPELRFCAYVDGERYGGAWSAGAVLALQCERIAIRRGRGLGAAVPIYTTDEGKIQVSPEGFSALTDAVGAAAGRNKYPKELALALINAESRLWAVPEGSGYRFTADPPDASSKADLIKPPGRVLALSAGECAAYGLGQEVEDSRQAARLFGLGDADLLAHESYRSLSEIARPQWDYLDALAHLGELDEELEYRAAEADEAWKEVSEVPEELADPAFTRAALARLRRHAERGQQLVDEVRDFGASHPRVRWAAGSIARHGADLEKLLQRVQLAELEKSVLAPGDAEKAAAEPPAEPPAAPENPLPDLTAYTASAVPGGTLVFPLHGPLTGDTTQLFDDALAKATAAGTRAVLLVIDSSAARPDVAPRIARAIMAQPQVRFTAYVDGERFGGASGPAALLPFCCERILVRRGAQVTAEELLAHAREPNPALAKSLAATKATWRAFAELHGHPGAVTDALLDHSFALWAAPEAAGHSFLRGTDDVQPPSAIQMRAQGQPLVLGAQECDAYGIGQPVADAAEVSKLLGLAGDLRQDAGYRTVLDWSRRQADGIEADKAQARRLADEARALADAATARPPAEADPERAVARLRESVKSAGRALELLDQIATIGRRDPLIEVEPASVRDMRSKLREWLGGVRATYKRLGAP